MLRNRGKILRWAIIGTAIAAIFAIFTAPQYTASASFIPQGTDVSRSGLASIAGQFGISIPTTAQSLSPDFYAQLLKSRVIMLPIVQDSFTVAEQGGRKVSFQTLFKIKGNTPAERADASVKKLGKIVGTSIGAKTGIVGVTVSTKWPSVSLQIITRLVAALDDFNQRTRQGQASAERKFVEGRLTAASADLRSAQDRLQYFLQNNREFARSPELRFENDRLQRDVDLQQQVYTSLTQSLEEARIREIRDTPVITLVEPPAVNALPESRRRILHVIFGFLLGAIFGAIMAFATEAVRQRRRDGDVEAEAFADTLGEVRGEMLAPVRTLKQRIRR